MLVVVLVDPTEAVVVEVVVELVVVELAVAELVVVIAAVDMKVSNVIVRCTSTITYCDLP